MGECNWYRNKNNSLWAGGIVSVEIMEVVEIGFRCSALLELMKIQLSVTIQWEPLRSSQLEQSFLSCYRWTL